MKTFLRLGALFMIADALVHFSQLRLIGTAAIWPEDAMMYVSFFQTLWASASLYIAGTLWIIADNPTQYKKMLQFIAVLVVGHSLLLYFFSFQSAIQNSPVPALTLWNPWYEWQIRLEALALNIFSFFVWRYNWKQEPA
jgi:hypothetical protein